jgi:hypothetical protein
MTVRRGIHIVEKAPLESTISSHTDKPTGTYVTLMSISWCQSEVQPVKEEDLLSDAILQDQKDKEQRVTTDSGLLKFSWPKLIGLVAILGMSVLFGYDIFSVFLLCAYELKLLQKARAQRGSKECTNAYCFWRVSLNSKFLRSLSNI